MLDTLVIVSGGMDSVTLLHYLVKKESKKPVVLTFSYGQKHTREIDCAIYQVKALRYMKHQIIDLSFLAPAFSSSALVSRDMAIPSIDKVRGDPQPLTYVPNRNMIFLSIAAAFAESLGINEVCYGAQAHDLYGYWDTTPEFVQSINALLTLNRKTKLKVTAPLVNFSKTEVLRLGLELGVDYYKTWSCYEGNDLACGKCQTCAERLAAFEALGISDPLPYGP
jgi:7-cyano-7-deazaguanine synthase